MELDAFIEYMIKLRYQGTGKFLIKSHNVSINEANGGNNYIEDNEVVTEYMINTDTTKGEIVIGNYDEYYSY